MRWLSFTGRSALSPRGQVDGLAVVVAFMGFVATLALSASGAVGGVAERWAAGLEGQATVELPAGADPASTLAALQGLEGVRGARALAPEEVAALVEPWLGPDAARLADLPLPRLIALRLEPGADAQAIAAALPAPARLDTHQDWLAEVVAMARAARSLALALLAAVTVGAGAAVAGATRARLAIQAPEIALLHTLGATDRAITAQCAAQAGASCVLGAAAGALAGAAVLAAASWAAPGLTLAPWSALWIPVGAGATGAGAAYAMVRMHLRETP